MDDIPCELGFKTLEGSHQLTVIGGVDLLGPLRVSGPAPESYRFGRQPSVRRDVPVSADTTADHWLVPVGVASTLAAGSSVSGIP